MVSSGAAMKQARRKAVRKPVQSTARGLSTRGGLRLAEIHHLELRGKN